MQIIDGIKVWGDPDPGALDQMRAVERDTLDRALMADHHFGYSIPIGGVVATQGPINPEWVGYDIACGNKAVRLDIYPADLQADISHVMDRIEIEIPFGVGVGNPNPIDHELFDDDAWKLDAAKPLKDRARSQLGSMGANNHYVDLFVDDKSNQVWAGVHAGSRGFGHGLTKWFLDKVKKGSKETVLLDLDSQLGQEYMECTRLAGDYAYAGRDWVCDRVASICRSTIVEEVHNNHNYAWREMWDEHGEVVMIRKGATPSFPGQKSFVGASMGEASVILEGLPTAEAYFAMNSTVHGAGRVMGRRAAKGKVENGEVQKGLVSREMMDEWINREGVELRGGDVDESPHCYKRLSDVLDAHRNTVKVLHTLRPIGVAMAEPHRRED